METFNQQRKILSIINNFHKKYQRPLLDTSNIFSPKYNDRISGDFHYNNGVIKFDDKIYYPNYFYNTGTAGFNLDFGVSCLVRTALVNYSLLPFDEYDPANDNMFWNYYVPNRPYVKGKPNRGKLWRKVYNDYEESLKKIRSIVKSSSIGLFFAPIISNMVNANKPKGLKLDNLQIYKNGEGIFHLSGFNKGNLANENVSKFLSKDYLDYAFTVIEPKMWRMVLSQQNEITTEKAYSYGYYGHKKSTEKIVVGDKLRKDLYACFDNLNETFDKNFFDFSSLEVKK
jgi:hypothetical protein